MQFSVYCLPDFLWWNWGCFFRLSRKLKKIRVFVANDGTRSFKFTLYYPNGNVLYSTKTLDAGKTFIEEFSIDQTGEYVIKYDSGTGHSVDGFFRAVEI